MPSTVTGQIQSNAIRKSYCLRKKKYQMQPVLYSCSYMTMSSLTYILGFSVKFFFQPIYTDYTNWTYFDKRSFLKPLNQIKPNLAGIVLG